MIKVEVQSAEVQTKSGTSAKTGKPYVIREQSGYAHIYGRDGKPALYPAPIRLTLDDDQSPYQPGAYILDPASIYVDRFGQLSLRAQLRHAHAAPAVKAA